MLQTFFSEFSLIDIFHDTIMNVFALWFKLSCYISCCKKRAVCFWSIQTNLYMQGNSGISNFLPLWYISLTHWLSEQLGEQLGSKLVEMLNDLLKLKEDKASCLHTFQYLSQLMWLWYLSHRWPAKAQTSLRICEISPEPSLFAHLKYGSRWRVRPKIKHLAPLYGCACTFEERVYGGQKVP